MEQERPLNTFSKFMVMFFMMEFAIFGGVAAVCWLGSWHSLNDYATGLFITGALVMGIGGASVIGSSRYTGNLTIRYIETVSDEDGKTRARRHQHENESSRLFALKTFIIGIIPLIMGVWLTIAPLIRR